jgi:8-oxo-dGTP diphosphatase
MPNTAKNRRPHVGVGAVVIDEDRLLMIRRGNGPAAGEWSLPGGHVEFGEPVAAALVREVFEETGLEVLCGPLIDWVERIDDEHHFVIFDFEAEMIEQAEPSAGSDAAEATWVPLIDVAEYALVDGLAEFLHANGYISTLT